MNSEARSRQVPPDDEHGPACEGTAPAVTTDGMAVYVAGSTGDVERVKGVQDAVRAFGHTITFDWTGAEGEIRTDGSWDMAPEAGARIAQREVSACALADLTILLFPPQGGGLGCWIEMGATLASGGEVWVVAPQRDSVFWQHPNVRRFTSVRHLMGSLAATITTSTEGVQSTPTDPSCEAP